MTPLPPSSQSRRVRRDCTRCGRRDDPGHGCDRRWQLPAWLKVGPLNPSGLRRSGFKRLDGSLSHTYWTLHWSWRGDSHEFTPRPSLGSHTNVSERIRRDQAERDLEIEVFKAMAKDDAA